MNQSPNLVPDHRPWRHVGVLRALVGLIALASAVGLFLAAIGFAAVAQLGMLTR